MRALAREREHQPPAAAPTNESGRTCGLHYTIQGCISCCVCVCVYVSRRIHHAASLYLAQEPFDSARISSGRRTPRRQDLYQPHQEHDFFLVPPVAIKRGRRELRETIARPPASLSIYPLFFTGGKRFVALSSAEKSRRAEYFSSCLQRARPNFLCPNKSTSYLVVRFSHFVLFVLLLRSLCWWLCLHSADTAHYKLQFVSQLRSKLTIFCTVTPLFCGRGKICRAI